MLLVSLSSDMFTRFSLACSSRRPRHRPSSQHMHVQVKNFLPGPSPVVDHQPVVAQSLLRRHLGPPSHPRCRGSSPTQADVSQQAHLGDDTEHVAEDAFVLGGSEPELRERLTRERSRPSSPRQCSHLPPLGNHEEMGGSLRVDIFEDQYFLIFKHNLRQQTRLRQVNLRGRHIPEKECS